MLPLLLILHIFIGAALAGAAVVAALAMGYVSMTAIWIAAALGFLAAFPVSYAVLKKID